MMRKLWKGLALGVVLVLVAVPAFAAQYGGGGTGVKSVVENDIGVWKVTTASMDSAGIDTTWLHVQDADWQYLSTGAADLPLQIAYSGTLDSLNIAVDVTTDDPNTVTSPKWLQVIAITRPFYDLTVAAPVGVTTLGYHGGWIRVRTLNKDLSATGAETVTISYPRR